MVMRNLFIAPRRLPVWFYPLLPISCKFGTICGRSSLVSLMYQAIRPDHLIQSTSTNIHAATSGKVQFAFGIHVFGLFFKSYAISLPPPSGIRNSFKGLNTSAYSRKKIALHAVTYFCSCPGMVMLQGARTRSSAPWSARFQAAQLTNRLAFRNRYGQSPPPRRTLITAAPMTGFSVRALAAFAVNSTASSNFSVTIGMVTFNSKLSA